ncbi:MAG: hypothetical protein RIK87_25355 [Fuerstiella sp.]
MKACFLIPVVFWLTTSAVTAHPMSHTDAWVRVSDVVDVRLIVLLDDVVRHQLRMTADQETVPVDVLRQAIADHSATLTRQLQIFDQRGRPLAAAVMSVPEWESRSEQVDLASNASLKLTWQLQYRPSSAPEDAIASEVPIRSLCFLHQFTHKDLTQPGELRLHLQHQLSGKRINAVVPPARPHTVLLPEPGAAVPSDSELNAATSTVVVGPLGVVHEFTAPLSLLDAVWAEAAEYRTRQQTSGAAGVPWTLDAETAEHVRQELLHWAQDNISLRLNGEPALQTDMSVEWVRPDATAEATGGGAPSAALPVFGTRAGIRMLGRPRVRVDVVEVEFRTSPGPFSELLTEVVTAAGQTSQLVPICQEQDEPAASYRWQRDNDSESPAPRESAGYVRGPASFDPVMEERRAGNRLPAGLLTLVGLCWAWRLAGGGKWSGRGRSLLWLATMAAFGVGLWAVTARSYSLDQQSASQLTIRLLERIYRATGQHSERQALAELLDVLDDDLAEEVYLNAVESLAGTAADGLLVQIDSVRLDSFAAGDDAASAGEFHADARWRVQGTVHHWGHTHRRDVVLVATLHLVEVRGQWKIRSIHQTQPARIEIMGSDSAGIDVSEAACPETRLSRKPSRHSAAFSGVDRSSWRASPRYPDSHLRGG